MKNVIFWTFEINFTKLRIILVKNGNKYIFFLIEVSFRICDPYFKKNTYKLGWKYTFSFYYKSFYSYERISQSCELYEWKMCYTNNFYLCKFILRFLQIKEKYKKKKNKFIYQLFSFLYKNVTVANFINGNVSNGSNLQSFPL